MDACAVAFLCPARSAARAIPTVLQPVCIVAPRRSIAAPSYRRPAVSSPSLPRYTATLPYRCPAVSLPCRIYHPAVPRPHCNAGRPDVSPPCIATPLYRAPLCIAAALYRHHAVPIAATMYHRTVVPPRRFIATGPPLSYHRPASRRRAVPPPHCIAAPLHIILYDCRTSRCLYLRFT